MLFLPRKERVELGFWEIGKLRKRIGLKNIKPKLGTQLNNTKKTFLVLKFWLLSKRKITEYLYEHHRIYAPNPNETWNGNCTEERVNVNIVPCALLIFHRVKHIETSRQNISGHL